MPSVAIIGTRGYPSYYGGFETAVRKLAPYLASAGWHVTVYGRPGTTRPEDPSRDPRVTAVQTRGLETKSMSTLAYGLTACLDASRRRPDVALVMNVANGYFLPKLKRAGIPTLVNVDGIEWDRAKWNRLAKTVFRRGALATARHGTNLVFDSHEIAHRWKEEFGREGLFIPYGGDLPKEPALDVGFAPRSFVLMVARFVPENTVIEFMDAIPILATQHNVVLVGSSGYGGELDERARALAEQFDRVAWLGHVSNDELLHSLWRQAGVYFHGHSVGGTNPALVQAMACGAPVVARDTVYNREVLRSAGKFCDPDSNEISTTIQSVMNDATLQNKMSECGVARVQESYMWQDVCESYERGLLATMQRGST